MQVFAVPCHLSSEINKQSAATWKTTRRKCRQKNARKIQHSLFLPILLWLTGTQERSHRLANSSDFMGLVAYFFLIAQLLRLWDCEDFKFNLKERLTCSSCGFKEMLEVKSQTSKTSGKYKDKMNQESPGSVGPGPPRPTLEVWQRWKHSRYFSKKESATEKT